MVLKTLHIEKIYSIKFILIILLLFITIYFFSCSGLIVINFSGKIIGYNPKDSASYSFKLFSFLEDYNLKAHYPKIDMNGNYQLRDTFVNLPPQCISLLKGDKVVDRYCINNENNDYGFLNVFSGNKISTPNLHHWKEYEIKNLNFEVTNYLKDQNILKFDSIKLVVNHLKENGFFEFLIDDPSNSIFKITIYFKGSKWKADEVDFTGLKFSIPEKDFPKNKYPSENMVHIRIYSKYGWYKAISKNIWE
jgi:hypothetical protein